MKRSQIKDKMLRPKLEDKDIKAVTDYLKKAANQIQKDNEDKTFLMNRTISIIHPSRGRPEMAIKTALSWINKQSENQLINEYLMLIDDEDPLFLEYEKLNCNAGRLIRIIINKSKSAIEAINIGAKTCTSDIIFVISDDMDCPEHWDTLLLDAIGDKTDFCAKASDGHQDWLITLPVMDRLYYNRFGYVYNPIYGHIYADLEMTCVAWMLDRYIKIPLTFEHKHPRYTGEPMDETYKRNLPTWITGKETFKKIMAENFGISEPVNELPKMQLIKQGIMV